MDCSTYLFVRMRDTLELACVWQMLYPGIASVRPFASVFETQGRANVPADPVAAGLYCAPPACSLFLDFHLYASPLTSSCHNCDDAIAIEWQIHSSSQVDLIFL